MPSATEIKRTSRRAGLLYLALSILAIISHFYLRPWFIVQGDAAATARNILAHEQLYRSSILIDLVVQVLFILVVITLYRLFEDVDRNQSRLMVALVGVGIAAQFAGFVWNVAPLVLLSGADFLAPFSRAELEALAFGSFRMAGRQGQLLTLLWGLWLFPFAALTIKSGFLPKFLGLLLILTGIAYVVTCVAGVVFPAQMAIVSRLVFPFYFGELIVVLWLAFIGAKASAAQAEA
jgi:hypothetical protein